MTDKKLASLIDLAVLGPGVRALNLYEGAKKAIEYDVATLCVNPSNVQEAKELLNGSSVQVSTVIGFPHGATTTRVKSEELEEALENGCNEFDIVMNLGMFMDGRLRYVYEELKHLYKVAHPHTVKVIIETGVIGYTRIPSACDLCEATSVLYVKTSTGFGPRGVTKKDINQMRLATTLSLKASGGIRTREQAEGFANLGCNRLGVGYKSIDNIFLNKS